MAEHTYDEERPSEEEISQRAYELYEARGKEDNHDLDDWFTASQQLMAEKTAQQPAPDPMAAVGEAVSI